jgi:hypothetical protein
MQLRVPDASGARESRLLLQQAWSSMKNPGSADAKGNERLVGKMAEKDIMHHAAICRGIRENGSVKQDWSSRSPSR